MNELMVWLTVLLPFVGGLLLLLLPRTMRTFDPVPALGASGGTLLAAWSLFGQTGTVTAPWAGFGFDLAMRLTPFSSFVLLAVGAFGFLLSLYSLSFLEGKDHRGLFLFFLLATVGMADGAVLADNAVLFLFFWEGLLGTLFAMIFLGTPDAWKAATKALIISGLSDLLLMLGFGIAVTLAGTLTISQIRLPVEGLGTLAFLLMVAGAAGKAGAMPFHTWIPDAATAAPLPFMAFLPGALEKLLGIYLLGRVTLDLFVLDPHSWVSTALMVLGAVTLLGAVLMAVIQKDMKKLLSYHAISQVGYMILGLGTAVPVGIVGGLFHMLNNALYKCCLFLAAGAVERQAGGTDLRRLGGLARSMPVTAGAFVIAACAISGVPPFNGFFSKELVYDAALERSSLFYMVAVLGSFFTAASFFKMGHAAFFSPVPEGQGKVEEAPVAMLAPMVVLALGCVVFGVWNALPLGTFIEPVLGARLTPGQTFAGWPHNTALVLGSLGVLLAAFVNHLYGVKETGKAVGAVDHIHHAPGLRDLFEAAEQRRTDPYELARVAVGGVSWLLRGLDHGVDLLYEGVTVPMSRSVAGTFSRLHTGNLSLYLLWTLVCGGITIAYVMGAL